MNSEFLGPFIDAETALDELRRSAAEVLGKDPNTWPAHKNAPLAVVAALSLQRGKISRLAAETEKLRAELDALRAPKPSTQSVPGGWLRAIDDALITAHIGVANAEDSYEVAKRKLDALIGFHVDVATDPAVNGGCKLVPIEPTTEMEEAGYCASGSFTAATATYAAMLAAAPKPEETK